MEKQQDSFSEIIIELEKDKKSKRAWLVAGLLILMSSLIYAGIYYSGYLKEALDYKPKRPVPSTSYSEAPSSSSTSSEDEEEEVKSYANSLLQEGSQKLPFLWTFDKAYNLPFDPENGGAELESVLSEFGPPDQAGGWTSDAASGERRKFLSLRWLDTEGSAYVALQFSYINGSYKAIASQFSGLPSDDLVLDPSLEKGFLWTRDYFNSLLIGARGRTDKGTLYDDITAQVGLPDSGSISVANRQMTLQVSYRRSSRNSADSTDIKSVILQFVKQEDGSWRLVSKQAS